MPTFHVRKTITIDEPVQDCCLTVRDFRKWPEWSPWLIAEPATSLTYSDDGDRYEWDGKVTGAGAMEVKTDHLPRNIK